MDKNSLIFVALLLISAFGTITPQNLFGQSDKITHQNPCVSKTTCHDCIQTQNCAWCLQPDFGDRPRCFQPDLKTNFGCPEEYTFNPDNEQTFIDQRSLTRGGSMSAGGSMVSGGSMSGGSSGGSSMSESGSMSAGGSSSGSGSSSASGSIVQISPQRVGLKLRINQLHKMKIDYSQAEDYPVDLYYLMDLSKSMEDDKEKLSKLGDLLSDTMRNITSNFRLGFGSFVDKVLMPYVSTVPKKLKSPCDGCEAPFGFKNNMQLALDTTKFAEEVKRAHVSGNLDAPEGGFDAIMQAVVCRDRIGWRDQARRLLVFSTDAGFHYAGDGKLGGVITPNDGECHLENDYYTHSTIQDYPSISQVNLKVKQNAINVIFAVTQQQIGVYKKLSEHIEGSSSAVLSEDSSNVVELVRDEYSKISSSVEMKDNAAGSIKVTYYSKCLGENRVQTNKCDGLKVGNVVSFETEIVVTSCPTDPKEWKQTFQIYPVGINESLTIDLEMLCSCPCEREGHSMFERNSPACKGFGTLQCGICDCNESHFGRNCECSNLDMNSDNGLNGFKCRPDNSSDVDCTGRGNCVCGQCECTTRENPEEIISGEFCQCDNFSCDRNNGVLCSGPEQGICDCGSCKCQPGWSGSACECRSSQDTCIAPNALNGEICSGHGSCMCGKCECEIKDDVRYSGKYCEKCPTCPGRCNELKDCVECQMYKKGLLKDADDCAKNCTLFVPVEVETVNYDEDLDEHLCTFYDEDDCRYQFVYSEIVEKNGTVRLAVRAQKDPECPPKVFLLGIVLGVIAAIVLIGLAMLLLWKLLTTIHDRREFARFEKERMMAKWDTGENPIYKQATSTFKNPTYSGK